MQRYLPHILLIIAAMVGVILLVNDIKNDAFDAGKAQVAAQYRQQVTENDRLNRQLETALKDRAEGVGHEVTIRLDEISQERDQALDAIKEIRDNCTIPETVIEARNRARTR
ncbi:hypothetical protein GRI62_11775 [Erythrobacter arachoides]|uniref:Uncharacterized protein n=1 Tax=Aurantiacibacter arachoides TaxID=1850444 RepID=A0A845A3J1_9SPHN|nr:hypothetical protein [Aurantiacibacter arachoides]MXO94274.1 hypothetical protein [Aurantiacibacter arachoides]GGD64765.1 hypothetical protein GCM10011411_26340 [Aurantiacibacter arachoides]